MLSEHLFRHLNDAEQLLCQPINRWEGFDLGVPEGSIGSLCDQILYTSWAAGAIGLHTDATPEQRARATKSLLAGIDRLIQRRVWANWANAAERVGENPDPIATGNVPFAGALVTMLGLAAALGIQTTQTPLLTLRWSHDTVCSYTHPQILTTLAAQMRAERGGAIATLDKTTSPSAMALVLWGLRLGAANFDPEQALVGERWIETVREKLALSGPRIAGRGALAATYHIERHKGGLWSNSLEDAVALTLMEPLVPDLVRALASRYWATVSRPSAVESVLVLAFSALLATELDESERATQLSAALDAHPKGNLPLPRALLALTTIGGLAQTL
jgi:hypothetical protein